MIHARTPRRLWTATRQTRIVIALCRSIQQLRGADLATKADAARQYVRKISACPEPTSDAECAIETLLSEIRALSTL